MSEITEWRSSAWRERATNWLDEQLAAAGAARTGPVTQPRVRAWGTVLTAPTTAGPVWLKAPSRAAAAEVGLYGVLAQVATEWTLPPWGVDVARGWVLLPDGGTSLREHPDGAATFEDALPRYARLQRTLAPHVPALLATGLPDMRAPMLPRRFDEALAAVAPYVHGRPEPAERDALQRVAALRPRVEEWAAELAGAAVPASIDHGDLHLHNVLVRDGGPPRFYDWGESAVAHPFASMLVALGGVARRGGPRALGRARDAYLEEFTDLAPLSELRRELDIACHAAIAARALLFQRALGTEDVSSPFAGAPFAILRLLLTGSWLGAY